jgi:hypothetical protein
MLNIDGHEDIAYNALEWGRMSCPCIRVVVG